MFAYRNVEEQSWGVDVVASELKNLKVQLKKFGTMHGPT